ncbi:MAG: hypothetical protein WCH37_00305 [Synechococcaceae cyanobacterium ELA182]
MKRFSRRVGHGLQQLKRPGAFCWLPLRLPPLRWLRRSGLQRSGLRRSGERPVEGDGRSPASPQASPLLLALLAAVVLHGLALSFRSVSLQRRPQPAAPSMADDSPELLQFSRRQPLEEALQTVPIAPLNSLPLMGNMTPPPASLPPNPAMSARFGTIPPGTTQPGTASGASRSRPAIAARGRRIAASRQQPGVAGGRNSLSAPGPGASVADSALARIHRLQGRGEAGEPSPASDLEPSSPPPQRPEGEAAAAWRRLWKRAMVVPSPATPPSLVSEAIELRRLPLSAAALDTASRDEPTALLLDGRLLLLWPAGSLLWLFWAPLRSVPVGGAQ